MALLLTLDVEINEEPTCCDACDPFTLPMAEVSQVPEKPTHKHQIHVKHITVEEMTDSDIMLKKALRKWCSQELEKKGFGGEDFYGDSLIMSERVLRRIVDLAHASKITNTTTFVEQVQWCYARKYAEEILELVCSVYPESGEV